MSSNVPPPNPPPPGYPPYGGSGPGSGGVGQRIEEAVELIEMELRHAVRFVNDAVVPQVRKESIAAMRTVAETLRGLADRMDAGSAKTDDPKGPQG